jgi:hypothetical protein
VARPACAAILVQPEDRGNDGWRTKHVTEIHHVPSAFALAGGSLRTTTSGEKGIGFSRPN